MRIKNILEILIAAVLVVATSIVTIYVANYLATRHKCRTRMTTILRLENILHAPNKEILNQTKKTIKEHTQELEFTIQQLQSESLTARMHTKQLALEHEITALQEELKSVEALLKLPVHQLLAQAKNQVKKRLEVLHHRITSQEAYIKQIKQKPDVVDQILEQRAQQALTHLQNKLAEVESRAAFNDTQLLDYFQNKIQEQAIVLKKQIKEKSELLKSPNVIKQLVVSDNQKRLKQLHKELAQEQEKLRMSEMQLIAYGKEMFDRQLVEHTIEAYKQGCKKD